MTNSFLSYVTSRDILALYILVYGFVQVIYANRLVIPREPEPSEHFSRIAVLGVQTWI